MTRNAEKGEQALLEREVWGVRQPALPHPSKGHLILGSRVLESQFCGEKKGKMTERSHVILMMMLCL